MNKFISSTLCESKNDVFCDKARKVHGNKYDYSKTRYTSSKSKVTITCPEHGDFEQLASAHLYQKHGCKLCSTASRSFTNEEFIVKARKTHGDKYDYSKSRYVKSASKLIITCPEHGDFEQTPSGHIYQKQGCPRCGGSYSCTTEEFIERARKIHGDKYDYSKTKYVNSKSKVIITCLEHGDFEQIAGEHLNKCRCSKCAKNHSPDTEEFIERARKIHGDKYDYSKTQYNRAHEKIVITCPEHGDFVQTAHTHINHGYGCSKCAKNHSPDTEEFIERARKIHGDKYDYSKTQYVKSISKVIITCPEHGDFEQTPSSHFNQKSGCLVCAGKHQYTNEEFIAKATKIHKGKYDYSKSLYVSSASKVIITCPEHGDFEQSPNAHFRGNGCSMCSGNYSRTTEDFIAEAEKVHGKKYDYSKTKYTGRKSKVIITCQKHGDFKQTAGEHLEGHNCAKCAGKWSQEAMLVFLRELKPFISMMDAGDLMALSRQKHIPKSLINAHDVSSGLVNRLRDLCDHKKTEQEKIEEFELIESEIASNSDIDLSSDDWVDDEEVFEDLNESKSPTESDSALENLGLTPYVESSELKMLNGFIKRYFSESETIHYLVSKRVNRLWYELFQTNDFDSIEKKLQEGECDLVSGSFMQEYLGAKSVTVPDGFSYSNGREKVTPNWMQLLTAYKLKEHKRIGNWSGVGAGKTLSAIFSGRYLGCLTTVVIANNNNIDDWKNAITTFFPNSSIVDSGNIVSLSSSGFRYVIVNYEKFQQTKAKSLVDKLLQTNPNFIVVDELQSVKNRTPLTESRRRVAVNNFVKKASEQNEDLYVLGMSATPCVNNLQEIRGLLELITGRDLSHMSTRPTWANASAFHELLVCNGLRYRPQYSQALETTIVPIDGKDWLQELLEIDDNRSDVLRQEQVLCRIKLKEIVSRVVPGTVIYTHYVDGLVSMLREACEEAGFKVGCFTGNESDLEKRQNKERFLRKTNRHIDVLIGSSAIGTGVDELQTVCSRLIFACLPWTNAEYEQIVGRVYRQGNVFDKVDVFIPQVVVSLGQDQAGTPLQWSRDMERMNIIRSKRTLMDCAIDGVRPTQDLKKEHKLASKGLDAMIKRISTGQDSEATSKPNIVVPLSDKGVHEKRMSAFTAMNRIWSNMKSESLHNLLLKEPKRWRQYHRHLSEARKQWTEIPFEVIAKQIKRTDWLIADLGCGEALFAKQLPNIVHSYDHVAVDDSVTACDIAHVPSKDSVYDAAVMSLVCMGANWTDYIYEANRILKPHGMLFIAESLKGVYEDEARITALMDAVTSNGFDILSKDLSGGFVYLKAVKS